MLRHHYSNANIKPINKSESSASIGLRKFQTNYKNHNSIQTNVYPTHLK